MEYINPQGKLEDIAKLVDLSKVQSAREINRDRITNKSLRSMWFWTSDFPLYTMDKGEVVLNMATCEHNLLFKNLSDGIKQLREKNNYFPNNVDIASIVNATSTVKLKLSNLKLQGNNSEWQYIDVDTKNYATTLNKTQKAFVGIVYGNGKELKDNMKMLSDSGITTTKLYVLNPEYVKNTLTQTGSKALARGSFLDYFSSSSSFGASSWYVGSGSRRLRGVSLATRSVDAPKIDEYDNALKLLTDNPQETLTRIQKNPAYASGLNALVGSYLSSKA